jgi:hypothetical protein
MKELHLFASNNLTAIKDGAIVPKVEAIIVTTEPVFRLSPDGGTITKRDMFQFRFIASPADLRILATDINRAADDCEAAVAGASKTEVES